MLTSLLICCAAFINSADVLIAMFAWYVKLGMDMSPGKTLAKIGKYHVMKVVYTPFVTIYLKEQCNNVGKSLRSHDCPINRQPPYEYCLKLWLQIFHEIIKEALVF